MRLLLCLIKRHFLLHIPLSSTFCNFTFLIFFWEFHKFKKKLLLRIGSLRCLLGALSWSILLKHFARISPLTSFLGSPFLAGACTQAASALYWLGRSAVGLISKQLAVDGGRPLARARDCPAARYGAHTFPHPPASPAEAKEESGGRQSAIHRYGQY